MPESALGRDDDAPTSVVLALILFVGVLVASALELPHLCLAALLGAAAMLLLGVTTHSRRHQQGLREVEGAGRSEHLAG